MKGPNGLVDEKTSLRRLTDLRDALPRLSYWFGLTPNDVFALPWVVLDEYAQALAELPPMGGIFIYSKE